MEASLALLNLTNTDWREAQFDDQTCVRGEIMSGGVQCSAAPGKQGANAGVADIHFTSGNPLGVRGGVTVYF